MAINNPYIPGDPYSYDLQWMVEKINAWKDPVESAEQAKASAEAAAASAEEASQSALKAFNKASQSATSAEQAKNYADHIADPVSGLVTGWLDDHITQPTNLALDTSLMVAGAAADAKAVGDIVLFDYPEQLNYVANTVFSLVTHDFFGAGGGTYAIIDLTGIDKLIVDFAEYLMPAVPAVVYFTGVPENATFLSAETMPDQSAGRHILTNYTCTIPPTATYALVQGYTFTAPPSVSTNGTMPKYIAAVQDQLDEVRNSIKSKVAYTVSGNDVTFTTTNEGATLSMQIGKRGPNNIPDFKNIVRGGVSLYLGSTDALCMPYKVAAINNIDGDDPGTENFTGGNHNYNNTGDNLSTPTGRNASLKFYADGVEITSNASGFCSVFTVDVVNYIQAYNTRKVNGTGREVLKEHKVFTWDGIEFKCYGETIPLEPVIIKEYFGCAMYASLLPNILYYGAPNRIPFLQSENIRSGNTKPSAIKLYSPQNYIKMTIDRSYDLGAEPMIDDNTSGAFVVGSKAYFYLIKNITFAANETTSSKIIYTFGPM